MHPVEEALNRIGCAGNLQAIGTGSEWLSGQGSTLDLKSPIDGSSLTTMATASADQCDRAFGSASAAFPRWRAVPPPLRGEFVRQVGDRLRLHKNDLATVVTWEAGKILQESLGEVQEMIDICDFAVGLSRQLYGLTIASERPGHRLAEQWHPLGPVGVISAFNFPVAVWAWNAMIAWVCGDTLVWKPSEKTPLCSVACHTIVTRVLKDNGHLPDGISNLIIGGPDTGQAIAASPHLPLVSATGSVEMGRAVARTVAARLGRSLLELGGNNAMIVAASADAELAIRAIVFAAVGTCGQRCTTLRRLIVHESIADSLVARLKRVYQTLAIGNPADEETLVGPLIDEAAFDNMQQALKVASEHGADVFGGERITDGVPGGGFYVRPALVVNAPADLVRKETFAPILYVLTYQNLADAIAINNGVPQGLASAIFTSDVKEAELFCSPQGSDCGIANVNIGTSGAEIGGAFGGEKETGGGRESGSDAWKTYMRRSTNTINYSSELPLAQGISFEV